MTEENKPQFSFPNSDRYTDGATQNSPIDNTVNNPASASEVKSPVHINDLVKKDDVFNGDKLDSVKTFQSDVAQNIKNNDVSIIKMALAEQRRQDTNVEIINQKKINWALYAIIVVLCLLIIGGIIFASLKIAKTPEEKQAAEAPTQVISGGLIYAEQSKEIDTYQKFPSQVVKEIAAEKAWDKIDSGKIRAIILTENIGSTTRQITSKEFLNIINTDAPQRLIRSLSGQMSLGYYFYNSNEGFIVVKVSDYDNAFAGMIEWEKSLYYDLGGIVSLPTKQGLSTNYAKPAATSTTNSNASTTNPTSSASGNSGNQYSGAFLDKIVGNRDARVLLDDSGRIKIMYTFYDKSTLIISASDKAIKEVIYRLTTGRISR